ncbi:peroxiredoxin-like family protein [Aureibacter tunicatorum]|uniref:thioredoxin-dependent peroxiredoxin n=1 Tax=Aureibacter tunicatorum TaxID=866807 RepID=A0AAE4BRV6_9BACT|nr:peroxiredoxin-like family protein [Aureibacter tunicatorum]MDR6240579.1 peroxiredoxin [Aureibacter tunicatorum]BDD06560.1 alkyl hydroperoxide reductase [Aureibacter tunicatorum]
MQTLKEQLTEVKNKSGERISAEALKTMQKATDELKTAHIAKNALKVGDTARAIILNNLYGNKVSLLEELKKGPVVLSFYRGSWCPYCNLELKALQEALPEIKKNGATLIAISPELPDNSLTLIEKHQLKFEILSDLGNKISKEYGLVFKLPDELIEAYSTFGINLERSNGDNSHTLPMPATFVIDQEGVIRYAFVPEDYRERAEPSEILEVLTQI